MYVYIQVHWVYVCTYILICKKYMGPHFITERLRWMHTVFCEVNQPRLNDEWMNGQFHGRMTRQDLPPLVLDSVT